MILLPLELPVDPSPDEAREWLREELLKSSYGHNWLEEFGRWWRDWFTGQDLPVADAAVGWGVIVGVLALLVAGVAWWAWRARVTTKAKADVFDDLPPEERMTAPEYRDLAARLLASGDFDGAAMAAFRALAVDLVRRTVLGDQPGRTAQEIARGVVDAFPAEAGALHDAARTFDVAAYGVAPSPRVTQEQAAAVMALDQRVAQTKPQWTAPVRA